MNFFSCKNLSKSFNQEKILEDINISFPSFGIVSIIGHSGCGKSTLLNCLLGLEACEGTIYFKGKKIKSFDEFRNKYTGVIFQNFHLFEYLTVKENITLFGKSKNYKKIISLLNLEDKINKKVKLLSGGEKQRVAIARTLMKNPKIIFCDEIVGSLDENNSLKIMKYIKEISKEILVINISHNIKLVNKFSDHVISLETKKVDFISPFEEKIKVKENKKILPKVKLFKNSLELLRKSIFKITLSIISLSISFSLVGIILCVEKSVESYITSYKQSALDYSFLELTITLETKIENTSFSLIKNTRPTKEELSHINHLLGDLNLGYNYSNLINSYTSLKSLDEELQIRFLPCLDKNITSYNQVIVNSKAKELIKNNKINYIQKRNIDYINLSNKVISDYIDLSIDFEVVGVNEELEFFQEPIVYYHYYYLEDYLHLINLENLSLEKKEKVSLAHRIIFYSFEGDYFNTGTLYFISNDINKVEETYEKINNFNSSYYDFKCISRSIENYNTIEDLFNKIIDAIEIFLIISLVISCLLMGLTINSLIIDEEKELGVLKSLGVLKKQTEKIVFYQIGIIIFISILTSFFAKYFIYYVIDKKIDFINLLTIENILFENMITILLSLIFSFIFSQISKYFVNKIKLSDVLRED